MQLVGDLPLTALGGLLSYAEEQEIKPLWIANFAISKLAKKENISYDDFIRGVFGEEMPQKEKNTSPSDIEAEFLGIAEIERKKLKKEGVKIG